MKSIRGKRKKCKIPDIKVRGEVFRFAMAMENILQDNDHKSHWTGESIGYLLRRIGQELGELRRAIKTKDPERIKKEAVDVGNFAMMIFDIADDNFGEERPEWLKQNVYKAFAELLLSQVDAEALLGEKIEDRTPLSLKKIRSFMKLPLDKRRRILAEEAEKAASDYANDNTRAAWQAGDFLEH